MIKACRLLLLCICSVSAFAVTSVELDSRQAEINRLNNRSIEILNQHALLKQIRDVRFLHDETGIVVKSTEYYALAASLLDKVQAFTVILDYSDAEIYSRREQLNEALSEISVLFWQLTRQRDQLLAEIDDANVQLASIRSYPSTYLGASYTSQMSVFEEHRVDVVSALLAFEHNILSEEVIADVGFLLSEVDQAVEAVFQRESMRLPELVEQFKALNASIDAWRQIKPELERMRTLKNFVLSAESQGYRFLAIERLQQLNLAAEKSNAWLDAADFPADIQASARADLLDIKDNANRYLTTSRNTTADDVALLNLLLKMRNELSAPCAQSEATRAKYDCQIVRQYQGVDTSTFLTIYQKNSGFLPIIERQIRAVYAGPEGYLND